MKGLGTGGDLCGNIACSQNCTSCSNLHDSGGDLPPQTTPELPIAQMPSQGVPGLYIIPCRPVTVPYNEDEGGAQYFARITCDPHPHIRNAV